MSTSDHNSPHNSAEERGNALLAKITATLTQTKASQWKEIGAKYEAHLKPKKPVAQWEHLFVVEIKAGYLILRCSLPVFSQFQGGGYVMTPSAPAKYVIELRERTWDPKTFVARLRGPTQGEPEKIETLANGASAEKLFNHIHKKIYSHFEERDQEFGRLANDTIKSLDDMVNAGISHGWEKAEAKNVLVYRAKIETVRVEVERHTRKEGQAYRILITDPEGLQRSFETNLAQRLFCALDDYDHNAGLSKLDDLLSGSL